MKTSYLIGFICAAKNSWVHAIVLIAAEFLPLYGWFKARTRSPLTTTASAGECSWRLSDVLLLGSFALLFYFGMRDFPFGTRDQVSLCAFIAGIAGVIRQWDF